MRQENEVKEIQDRLKRRQTVSSVVDSATFSKTEVFNSLLEEGDASHLFSTFLRNPMKALDPSHHFVYHAQNVMNLIVQNQLKS